MENQSCETEELHNALNEIFSGVKRNNAAQKHLVKHLDEWKTSLDSIPELHELSVDLCRDHDHEFLTKGAMALDPMELLQQEREAILDMPFDGLDDLDDSPRVKVLRTAREVEDVEDALNISFLNPR